MSRTVGAVETELACEALGGRLAAQALGRGPLAIDAKVDPAADAAALLTPLGAGEWSPAPRPKARNR